MRTSRAWEMGGVSRGHGIPGRTSRRERTSAKRASRRERMSTKHVNEPSSTSAEPRLPGPQAFPRSTSSSLISVDSVGPHAGREIGMSQSRNLQVLMARKPDASAIACMLPIRGRPPVAILPAQPPAGIRKRVLTPPIAEGPCRDVLQTRGTSPPSRKRVYRIRAKAAIPGCAISRICDRCRDCGESIVRGVIL